MNPPNSAYDEGVIFTAAMRRGVFPLFLVAMWQVFPEGTVEEWAEDTAAFVRDMLPGYPGNPLVTQRSLIPEEHRERLVLCYSAEFVGWFIERYLAHKGVRLPGRVLHRYWSLVRGEGPVAV